jgi:hypothetical protein
MMPDFYVFRYEEGTDEYRQVKGPGVSPARLAWEADDGTDANGQAAVATQHFGRYLAFPIDGAGPASLVTNLGVTNADLMYIADAPGAAGNSIRIRYVAAGNNTALSVSVSTLDITVNLATNGSGVPTSTATAVMNAVNGNASAAALVTASLAPGDTGAGIVPAMGFTFLSGGTSGAVVITNTTTHLVADSVPLADTDL